MTYLILKKIFRTILILVLFINCTSSTNEKQEIDSAKIIIAKYYKNKYLNKSIVLEEKHRIVLDSIVLRLEETNEPKVIIQFIVNDYKIKYGIKYQE